MWTETREMVDRLVPPQQMGEASCLPLGATNKRRQSDKHETPWPTLLVTSPSKPNNIASTIKPCNVLQQWCHYAPFPFNTQSVRVPITPAHLFFLCNKIPVSHRARGGTPTVSLSLGANWESQGKASRIHSSRTGSALVCVRRNTRHRELKFPESTRFALITAVMVTVPTRGPAGCPVSPLLFSSPNLQSHEKSPSSHRTQGETPTEVLRWAQILRARREPRIKLVVT